MLSVFVFTVFLLKAQFATAIDFSDWDPQGLPAEFQPFLEAYVHLDKYLVQFAILRCRLGNKKALPSYPGLEPVHKY